MALDLQTIITEVSKTLTVLRSDANYFVKALAIFDLLTTFRNQIPSTHPALYGKLGDGKLLKLFLDNLPLLLSLLPLFLEPKK